MPPLASLSSHAAPEINSIIEFIGLTLFGEIPGEISNVVELQFLSPDSA